MSCKNHLICYKSKMAKDSGNWKFGGRFRVNNPNKGLADKCAGNDGTKGWHALQVTEEGNGTATLTNFIENLGYSSVSNGLKHLLDINITKALSAIGQSVGEEFLKALRLGAFMKDYDGMALQIAAMEILRTVGEKDEKLCKKTCAAKWEQPTETTEKTSTTAKNVNHHGVNCIQIEFPEDIPQFVLNVSASSPYGLACIGFQKQNEIGHFPNNYTEVVKQDYVDACAQVPTSRTCKKALELYACFKSNKNQTSTNKEIAEICQNHLQKAPFVAGFRVRICVHRDAEKQLLVVESILDFSFSDKIFNIIKKFSIKFGEFTTVFKRIPIFFIEFGNENQQTALREKSGGKRISDDLNKEKATIGETAPSTCDIMGDDCEPTRELLLKIEEILRCCSPSNPKTERCICAMPTPDPNEFTLPPGVELPTPSSGDKQRLNNRKGDPLMTGDIRYTKEQAQQHYNTYKKACASCGPSPKKQSHRQKRQAPLKLRKWTKFPIAISFDQSLGDNPVAWELAIERGANLIMKDTCINFTFDLNREHNEGIQIYDSREGCGSSEVGRSIRKQYICGNGTCWSPSYWHRLSLTCTDALTAAHELLHALGLYHEHQRNDARNFIKFNPKERDADWLLNYELKLKTDNFGFPFDFGSVMHYYEGWGAHDAYALITIPRIYQQTIGQSDKISFKDLAIINRIYCQDTCKNFKIICENGGYPHPRQCEQCLCPEGYGGTRCESLEKDRYCLDFSGFGGYPKELVADWQTRELKPELSCEGIALSCSCHWRIKPKEGKKVRIHLKMLNEALKCEHPCKQSYVEVKYRKDKRASGARLCCSDLIRLETNFAKNWIEADGPNVDIIISAHIKTKNKTNLFELTYETDGAKLVSSNDCPEGANYDEKRNPGHIAICDHDPLTGAAIPCCPEGQERGQDF
uniref:Metalloendopeptidase n=1 Tax=Globodera pallida TaxID=36090 RepID=A0A183CEX3_GLOPA